MSFDRFRGTRPIYDPIELRLPHVTKKIRIGYKFLEVQILNDSNSGENFDMKGVAGSEAKDK